MKYGSSSCSVSLRDSGGKRPRTSGPGNDCGSGSVGDVGETAPSDDTTTPLVLSLAEVDGIGSQPWPGVGFAGSRGGALRLFLGTDDAGCEVKTSF